MACGATLKRSYEFDPLHSPGRSPKRMCMPGELLSPPSHTKRLAGAAFAGAAKKFVTDHLAALMTPPGARDQCGGSSAGSPHVATTPQLDRLRSLAAHTPSPAPLHQGPLPAAWGLQAVTACPVAPPRDAPVYTLKQVDAVCRRMVEEHEGRCREQFDRVLSDKLAEQYESFLNFNHTQLSKRFDNCDTSYVS